MNLTKEEFASLKSLSKNDSLIIQKSDKGNSVAIIDKDDYLQKMWNILCDSSKLSEIFVTNEKHLNFLVNIEQQNYRSNKTVKWLSGNFRYRV